MLTHMQCVANHIGATDAGRLSTFLDLSPLPLANAGATGIGQDSAAHLCEGVQEAVTFNGGSAIHNK